MIIQNRHGERFASLDDWRDLGGPASASHWVDGRSAKCLAEAWIGGSAESELKHLLDTDPSGELANFDPQVAIAEAQTPFDAFPGGRRNHDLLVEGIADGGRTIVGIESKADETFGPTLTEYRAVAERRRKRGERTNAPARLEGLRRAFFGRDSDWSHLAPLRYQLFSAIAGTIAAARERSATQAVFLVHEFSTHATDPVLQRENAADLARFIQVLFDRCPSERTEWLLGPFDLPESDLFEAPCPLWIGHSLTPIPSSSTSSAPDSIVE